MGLFGKDYPYYLGYALSGGGSKGFAHLGALKVLESYKLKPDVIAGTSAGALAGVFYADGFAPDEISELFEKKEFREFISLSIPKSGFFKATGLQKFLKNNLRSTSFDQLQIPLKVVATDWKNAQTVVISEGDSLIDAVVASCTVPVVFSPIEIGEYSYVDGGLLKNFPVSVIRNDCRYVLGVNVSLVSPLDEKISLRNVAERSFHIMSRSNSMMDSALCDILVEIQGLQKYSMFDLNNIHAIKETGYERAAEALGREKSLRIIRRCYRRYELEEKVKAKLDLFKKPTQ